MEGLEEKNIDELNPLDESNQKSEEVIEKKKLTRKEKKKLKKEQKKLKKAKWKEFKKNRKLKRKEKRRQLKEDYSCAPFLVRFVHLHRITTAIIVLCLLNLLFILCSGGLLFAIKDPAEIKDYIAYLINDDIRFMDFDMDEVYAMTPIDEEGAARIEALPDYSEEDTWTFCFYVVGSNLESLGEDDLSTYVNQITMDAYNENTLELQNASKERFNTYSVELAKNGLDMPGYMYEINKPIAASYYLTEDVIVADSEGFASTDISEVCSVDLPDNITFVIQTGGSTRWSNSVINPNRTQRFVYKNGVFSEVEDMHLQDSCDPDTLTSFIKYCDNNYKADHMALILWDHGGGVTGYGVDEIYNSRLSLAELRQALSKAVHFNKEDPYFEIIGFDACMMATVETAATFEGYGQYLVASEELEPGDGWDYYTWLNEMVENPNMNAADVSKAIADAYMDYYTKQNIAFPNILMNAATFSVVDINKASETLEAYDRLNEKLLNYVADDATNMTKISRAATKTVRYSQAYYRVYNLIDLGMYIDYLSEDYPEECAEVQALLKEAVLYKRSNLCLEGSQGLSVYFPVSIEGYGGMDSCLEYIYEISDKQSTNALYYYKISGCLNAPLNEYVQEVTGKRLKVLNTKIFKDYEKIMPEISEDNEIVIDIDEKLQNSIEEVSVLQSSYDDIWETLTYYGCDDSCSFNEDGDLIANINTSWFALDGSTLEAELSYSNEKSASYRTRVLHNGEPSYLTFTVDKDTNDIAINSVVPIPNDNDLIYDAALRTAESLIEGDTIIPLITKQDLSTGESTDSEGEKIKYKENSKIEYEELKDGQYLASIFITDQRADEYYSPVIEYTIKNGKIKDAKINLDFVGN